MAFKQKKHYNKTPQRRRISGVGAEARRVRRTPITFVWEVSTVNALVTFDQPVIYSGILPAWDPGVMGADIVSVSQSGPAAFTITFDATIAAATEMTVGFEDPSFRNHAGGYVNAGPVPVYTP